MTNITKLAIDKSMREIAILRTCAIRLGETQADEIDNYVAAELARVFNEYDSMDEATLMSELLKDIMGAIESAVINGQETD